jgi:hypothetical protein
MTFFILLGMLIGHIFNTEEMAMFASISLGTLFLLTSGIIFPLESMPASFIEKARFNPVVLGSDAFGRSLLFDASFSSVKTQIGWLMLFSLVIVGLIYLIGKADKFQFLLQSPNRAKAKKEFVMKQFDFGDRKAKTLPEFVVSVQNMDKEDFANLIEQGAISNWILLVYRNRKLANKLKKVKDKQKVVKILVEELKKAK